MNSVKKRVWKKLLLWLCLDLPAICVRRPDDMTYVILDLCLGRGVKMLLWIKGWTWKSCFLPPISLAHVLFIQTGKQEEITGGEELCTLLVGTTYCSSTRNVIYTPEWQLHPSYWLPGPVLWKGRSLICQQTEGQWKHKPAKDRRQPVMDCLSQITAVLINNAHDVLDSAHNNLYNQSRKYLMLLHPKTTPIWLHLYTFCLDGKVEEFNWPLSSKDIQIYNQYSDWSVLFQSVKWWQIII